VLPDDFKGLIRTVIENHPAAALLAAAEGADLLVVGSRVTAGSLACCWARSAAMSWSTLPVPWSLCDTFVISHATHPRRWAPGTGQAASEGTGV
jgi:hypothetical protein